MNDKINPVKQGIILKQYLGCFLALVFPITARGLIELTKIPLISAVIGWVVCGILLRYLMDNNLPFFHPQVKKVKAEIVALLIGTVLCGYLFIRYSKAPAVPAGYLFLNALVFAVFNGSFEHLVWVNIFDLAGTRFKILGFMATITYIILINLLFWARFIPVPIGNYTLFIISQLLIFFPPFIMYLKTRDITIWSIQHIIYNLMVVFIANFGINAFLHI